MYVYVLTDEKLDKNNICLAGFSHQQAKSWRCVPS